MWGKRVWGGGGVGGGVGRGGVETYSLRAKYGLYLPCDVYSYNLFRLIEASQCDPAL